VDNNKAEAEVKRDLELLCVIARSMAQIEVRLGHIVTLAQQQNDLLRRLLERRDRV
jgi:hypothetical protein